MTDDQLGKLTWRGLEEMQDVDGAASLKKAAKRLYQPNKSTDRVFPSVPEGTTLTAYLQAICARAIPAAPAQAGQTEAAGAAP